MTYSTIITTFHIQMLNLNMFSCISTSRKMIHQNDKPTIKMVCTVVWLSALPLSTYTLYEWFVRQLHFPHKKNDFSMDFNADKQPLWRVPYHVILIKTEFRKIVGLPGARWQGSEPDSLLIRRPELPALKQSSEIVLYLHDSKWHGARSSSFHTGPAASCLQIPESPIF